MSYIAPEFEKEWFNCPNCNAFSKQDWSNIYAQNNWQIKISNCQLCNNIWIWYWKNTSFIYWRWEDRSSKLIYPKKSNIPLPNNDLDEDIQNDYIEASEILNESPRWAGWLLRLALQKLMKQLWEDWKNIDKNIGSLVKKWLNITIQQALDSIRVIWNEAVHPWELDLKDDIESVTKLFGLINFIADTLITQPKKIQELYWTLPEWKLEGIENRDK